MQKIDFFNGKTMSTFHPIDGLSIFDDKGEVKRLVEQILQETDPQVAIDGMRKMDFSYIFVLTKNKKKGEVELLRSEIDASWEWRKGNIEESLFKKVQKTISELS